MSFFHRPTRSHRLVPHTLQIPKDLAIVLVPLVERLLADNEDGSALRTALRPFFLGERPRIAVLKGEDVCFHLEGPQYDCGGQTFPLGAQVFIGERGWLNLGPVEAAALHKLLREAIDTTTTRWIIERDLLDHVRPLRAERNRRVDDPLALRQMAAAAGLIHQEGEPGDA